jgi:hypothetical protein
MKTQSHKNKNIAFHLEAEGHAKTNPILLRISITSEYTKVDFGYTTSDIYIRGGWIKISPNTFIENASNKKRYKMIDASGITIAPKKHNFKSNKDWQYYSLYFEPMEQKDCILNIIEKENGTLNDFNYYNIEIKMSEGLEIM